jgi:hypothetical protein
MMELSAFESTNKKLAGISLFLAVICVLQLDVGEGTGAAAHCDAVACLCPIHVLTVSREISLSARRARNMPPLDPKTGFRFSLVYQISATAIAGYGC